MIGRQLCDTGNVVMLEMWLRWLVENHLVTDFVVSTWNVILEVWPQCQYVKMV